MKKILFVASECVPFVKTGGLADVVGALPKYFDKEKYEVRMEKPVCGNHGDGICGDSLLFHRQ